MRRIFIWIVILMALMTVFLIYNHKRLPTEEDVFKITEKLNIGTEEVYFVRKIDGDWLTIFRNRDSITIARLQQNWSGYWEFRHDQGFESTLNSTYYPPMKDDEITWGASSSKGGNISYYFGQIINPVIKKIEVETKKDFFEEALIIYDWGTKFFFIKSDHEMLMPVNIRAFSETGQLIYSTIKPIREEVMLEEINSRDELEIVKNVTECEDEEVYCFNYDSNIIVKMEMDNAQKGFYELMTAYTLPTGGVIEDAGSLHEYMVYENGYKFYTRNKMFFEAPNHSMDEVKPTEDQYFGIVMMWVELFGGGTERIENKEQAQSTLDSLNKLKAFAQDKIVLTWIENCSAILQQIVDEENPNEELYLNARLQLNYLGNVVQIYRYENGKL